MSMRTNHIVLALATIAGLLSIILAPDRIAVANWILGLVALVCWLFVGAYGIRSNWRATPAGRAVMRLSACMGLVCTHGVLTILTEAAYPGRTVIRPLLLFGIFLAVLDLLLTLVSIQRNQLDQEAK